MNTQAKAKDTNRTVVHRCRPLDTRQLRDQTKVNMHNKVEWSTHRMVATCITSKAILIPHMVNKPISSVSKRHTPTLQHGLTLSQKINRVITREKL